MAEDQGDPIELEDDGTDVEIDSLAGEMLFDVPDDLLDVPDPGAPKPAEGSDPAKGGPPEPKPGETRPRDEETGKFIPAKDAPATDDGQSPESAQADLSAPLAAADAEEQAEPELEFSFRSDGQTLQIEGSKVTKDGIFIPRVHMAEFQRLCSHGVTYQGSYRRRLDESAQREADSKAEVQENVVRADAYLTFMADLLDRTERGDTDQEGRTPLEAWMEGFRQNRVRLEADATLAVAKALREQRPATARAEGFDDDPNGVADSAPDEEVDLEELSQTKIAPDLGTRFAGLVQKGIGRGLTGAELTRIRDSMADPRRFRQFYKRVTRPVPAAEWGGQHDLAVGTIVGLTAAIEEEFKYQADLILNARKDATALAAAASKNGVAGGNRIPPTTTVRGSAVPKGPAAVPKFNSKEEMEAWFNGPEGDPA